MENLRKDFPQLQTKVHSQTLIYLDSAATTLKPQVVADQVAHFLKAESANIHRGAHYTSHQATLRYEGVRKMVADFLHGESEEEVVFTKGTTESINLVASSLGESLSEGDEVLITELEHHSNIIPWQLLCERKKLSLNIAPIEDDGSISIEKFRSLLTPRTRIASFAYVSNVLGMRNPVEQMIKIAKNNKTLTLVDAAQAVSCMEIDVTKLGCDFLVFSAHKIFGPFGVGLLWGRKELLNSLPPYQGGGGMISNVNPQGTSTYLASPHRFEAGTPNVSGVIGLQAALDYFCKLDINEVYQHKKNLAKMAYEGLKEIDNIRFIGNPSKQINLISFVIKGLHYEDLGALLDQQGVAIRVGHLCAQPLMKRMGISGAMRASFSIYNKASEIDVFIGAIKKTKEILS